MTWESGRPDPDGQRLLRREVLVARQQADEVQARLDEERARRRVLERELSAYRGSRAHRAAEWMANRWAATRADGRRMRPRIAPPLFDPVHYLLSNPDVRDAEVDPWAHYCDYGWREGRDPNPLFDTDWYIARYSGHLKGEGNPLIDYVTRGWRAGRDPGPGFSTEWYLRTYPDVRLAGVNPLAHFLSTGAAEGRKPTYASSPRQYAATTAEQGIAIDGAAGTDLLTRRTASYLLSAKERTKTRCQADLDAFLHWHGELAIPCEGAQITAVVVVWNQAALTFACLRALAESTVPVRVIVVDNGSRDETSELLEAISGIEVIRNRENRGFVLAVNQALGLVETAHVVLLNNDAEVAPDALERAIDALGDPSVGAVGGRVILPNRLLQEAGSYLDHEGRAHGYLRGEPPWAGDAMYSRPVDFCSGVFLAMRTEVVRSLGGLDVAFAPAYGEEVDLCLRMWQQGLEVVYDPRIVVNHLEYGSAADSAEPSRLMERNRGLLLERHGQILMGRSAWGDSPDRYATCRMRSPRVLFIEDRVPRQYEGAGFPRSAALVRALAAHGMDVTVLPMYGGEVVDWPGIWAELGVAVRVLPEIEAEGAADYLAAHGWEYEVVWVCRAHNLTRLEGSLSRLRHGSDGGRIIYDSECISTPRELSLERLDPAAVATLARTELLAELGAARSADLFVAVNDYEADLASRVLPGVRTSVIGTAVTIPAGGEVAPPGGRRTVLVVGRHTDAGSPNVVALNWFIGEVLPLLPPDTVTRVVGLVDPGLVTSADRVDLAGAVPDLHVEYDASRLLIAPQRFAAGIPLKVIEAAAAGVPVVATSLIAAQLGWQPGREIAVADTAEDFAHEVQRLLDDDEAWLAMSSAARERVAAQYSAEGFAAAVGRAVGVEGAMP